MPVHGEGFGKKAHGVELRGSYFCYSAEETVEALEAEIRKLARVFDAIVIDDAFLTACRCPSCLAACGPGDPFAFRRDLLCRVAERWVAAAREENGAVRVIVKFPQYYDRYARFGYDIERFPDIFDAVWVGTETRNPDTIEYGYVEPYQGYVNAQWMRTCAGNVFESAWFDGLDCDEQLFYDQGLTTYLAAVPALTVFSYDEDLFGGSKITRFAGAMPDFERLRRLAASPRGMHVLKPKTGDGGRDLFIFDYLGMLGIPSVFVTRLTSAMRSVFVSAHGVEDVETIAAMKAILAAGGQVIITFEALHRMIDNENFLEIFGFDRSGVARAVVPATCFGVMHERFETETPVHLAGDLAPFDASVLAWGAVVSEEQGTICVPLVTSKTYAGGGRALVWNLCTFGHEAFRVTEQLNVPERVTWFGLPKALVDLLRGSATETLGFRVAMLPRVACFVFERHVVLVNYTSGMKEVHVQGLHLAADTLFSNAASTSCAGSDVLLAPHSFAAVEIHE